MFAITALYAALLTLLFVFLSRNVIVTRRRQQVAISDQGYEDLARRIRAQGNFAEYVPLTLLLMALAESQGLPALLLHGLGLTLLTGRVLHAVGLPRVPEDFRFRVAGMTLTFVTLISAAAANLVLSLTRAPIWS